MQNPSNTIDVIDVVRKQEALNEAGRVSGRAQAAVRTIPAKDFNRIIDLGFDTHDELLPRTDTAGGFASAALRSVLHFLFFRAA